MWSEIQNVQQMNRQQDPALFSKLHGAIRTHAIIVTQSHMMYRST